ncbi:MAG: hypothetical protein ACE5K0_08620, partial [Candidatus Methanofastidiosia archaeon]
IIAGNAREGTYGAALKFREILTLSQEALEFSRELDKVLIWMFTEREVELSSISIVVRYLGEEKAQIVDIIYGFMEVFVF